MVADRQQTPKLRSFIDAAVRAFGPHTSRASPVPPAPSGAAGVGTGALDGARRDPASTAERDFG